MNQTNAAGDNEMATLNFKLKRFMDGRMFMEATNAREVVAENVGHPVRTDVDLIRVSQNALKTAWEIDCYKEIRCEFIDHVSELEPLNETPHRGQYKSRFAAMAAANERCDADHNNRWSWEWINSEWFCEE